MQSCNVEIAEAPRRGLSYPNRHAEILPVGTMKTFGSNEAPDVTQKPAKREFLFSQFKKFVVVVGALLAGLFIPRPGGSRTNPGGGFRDAPGPATRRVMFGSRQVRAHDPSAIVKGKDEYWIFSRAGVFPLIGPRI